MASPNPAATASDNRMIYVRVERFNLAAMEHTPGDVTDKLLGRLLRGLHADTHPDVKALLLCETAPSALVHLISAAHAVIGSPGRRPGRQARLRAPRRPARGPRGGAGPARASTPARSALR